jgi:hypothetical protein
MAGRASRSRGPSKEKSGRCGDFEMIFIERTSEAVVNARPAECDR